MHLLVNHFAKTINHQYSLIQYIIISLFLLQYQDLYFRMHIACAIITQCFFDFFLVVLYFKIFKFTWCTWDLYLRIALNWLKYTPFYLKHIHVLLFKLYPKFIALGTKHFLKKILKKTSKRYCFILWVGFICLKATEARR